MNITKNDIVKIGYKARELVLEESNNLIIHSVFQNAFNLICSNDFIVGILNETNVCTTQSLVFKNSVFNNIYDSKLKIGNEFKLFPLNEIKQIEVLDLTVPCLINPNKISRINDNVDKCLRILKKQCNSSIMACYLYGIKTIYTDMLYSKLGVYELNNKSSSLVDIYNRLQNIIGLGVGLTPSGDDFIYGFLTSLFFKYEYDNKDNKEIIKLTENLVKRARTQTTILSYNMLRSCINGEFNESIRKLALEMILSTNTENSLDKVLTIGSTSGADMVAGLLYGFKLLW